MSGLQQAINFSNISATTAAFTVEGGIYSLDAQFTGTSIQLQMLALDGSTWLNVGAALSAPGVQSPIYLAPGQYRLALTAATAVYASLARVAV